MSTLIVRTAEGISLRREIAGAGSRLAAGLLDLLLLAAGYLLLVLGVLVASAVDPTGLSGLALGMLVGGTLLVAVLYHVLFHLAWKGRTPGKAALGLRVLSADGYPASALQVVLRGLIWLVDVLLLVPLPLGWILVAATERHQRLGDLVAGTLVVHGEHARSTVEPWPQETWSALSPRVLALSPGMTARLRPADVAFLRDLVTRTELDPEARRRLFVEAARHYSARLGLGEFDDARLCRPSRANR
jgi:uncharacterized RDD family membrane protein YckC